MVILHATWLESDALVDTTDTREELSAVNDYFNHILSNPITLKINNKEGYKKSLNTGDLDGLG